MLLWLFGFYHKTEHKVQFLKKMPSNCSKRKDSRSKTVYIYIYIYSLLCFVILYANLKFSSNAFKCKTAHVEKISFFPSILRQKYSIDARFPMQGRENILFFFNFKAKILNWCKVSNVLPFDTDIAALFLLNINIVID